MTLTTYSPLLTDLYQITMAYAYWQQEIHEKTATFHYLFRKNPFKGSYALNCGLATLVDYLATWHFKEEDLAYLATLKNAYEEPLFPQAFLAYLQTLRFSCDVDAISEGTIIFPNAPSLRIEGPLVQCQLLETPILTILNFQTLIATKASRVCHSAEGDPVIEFGMRRAQGPDGALSASRAAYIGGCVGTSNTLAGKYYDIPVRGTHAHSFVTAFSSELEAFSAYAAVLPHNSVLLVDTYQTITGVKNAIKVGKTLREKGGDLLGIRLDSGDMAALSIEARQLLDSEGFTETEIIASNSLDEYVIADLKRRGAKITTWGVGTNLVTAHDHAALDGVYKLTALKNNESYEYKLKLSEQSVKVSNPGRHQVRRFFMQEKYAVDVIYDLILGMSEEAVQLNETRDNISLTQFSSYQDLLQPIFRQGELIATFPNIHEIRQTAILAATEWLSRADNFYPVALEENLYELKESLVKKYKAMN